MSKEQKEMLNALKSAHDICVMVKETMDDIIAGSNEPEESDVQNSKSAGVYLDWYNKQFKNIKS